MFDENLYKNYEENYARLYKGKTSTGLEVMGYFRQVDTITLINDTRVMSDSVQRCTGYRDKGDNLLWEGDDVTLSGDVGKTGQVVFHPFRGQFVVVEGGVVKETLPEAIRRGCLKVYDMGLEQEEEYER